EFFLSRIDARKHGRRREQLEGAAHREALFGAIFESYARSGVEHSNAEAASDPGFDAFHFSRKNFRFRFSESRREKGGASQRAADDKAASSGHDFPWEDLKFAALLRPLDRFHDEALGVGRIQPLGEFHPFSLFEILVVLEEMRGLLAHDGRQIAIARNPG